MPPAASPDVLAGVVMFTDIVGSPNSPPSAATRSA
jgi:hypothetical protein